MAFEDAEGGRGAVAVNARLWVDLYRVNGAPVVGGPLAAGEFDFGEFWHAGTLG